VCVCVRMYVSTSVCMDMYACMYLCVYVCMYVCSSRNASVVVCVGGSSRASIYIRMYNLPVFIHTYMEMRTCKRINSCFSFHQNKDGHSSRPWDQCKHMHEEARSMCGWYKPWHSGFGPQDFMVVTKMQPRGFIM
jgi:hypothetical protein